MGELQTEYAGQVEFVVVPAEETMKRQDEIDGSRESYNFFASMTNGAYLSYDGASAQMRTVNNDPGISCPNANWNGISTNYCNGGTGQLHWQP